MVYLSSKRGHTVAMSGRNVILGVPEEKVIVPCEKGITKIGGIAHWIAEEPPGLKGLRCSKCKSQMAHILSADCPITSDTDRVIYVFICPKCGQDARVWRQKAPAAPEEDIIAPVTAPAAKVDTNSALAAIANFQVGKKNIPAQGKGKKANRPNYEKGYFCGYYVETFEEPEAELDAGMKVTISGSNDSSGPNIGSEEDRVDVDPILIEFNERISRCPSQVIRYSPGDKPLLQDAMELKVDDCPLCGGRRSFELEIIPTIIYILDRNSDMDFGPILIYCCENDCGMGTAEEQCIICPP